MTQVPLKLELEVEKRKVWVAQLALAEPAQRLEILSKGNTALHYTALLRLIALH